MDLDAEDVGSEALKVEADGDDLDLKEKKKKKKPKKQFNMDDLEAGLEETAVQGADETPTGEANLGADEASTALDISDSGFFGKKKKKKERRQFDEGEGEENDDSESVAAPTTGEVGTSSWANSDRDYTYEELLNHVFNIIKEKNPDIIAGEKKKLVMRPPQVLRVGTKKTSFANFLEICKS